ncbi:MAG: ABC transporter substrate-binding protein [Clostridia bacterium]|nr:ABC transporter substrate-binding protein [Clostridia bacterium]
MKKSQKILSLVLGGAVSVSMIAGCNSSKKQAETSPDDNVKLTWMMLGPGEQKDTQMVVDEFNKQLEGIIPNTSLELKVYSTSEYAEKYKLVSAANEPIDLIWIGWLIDYPTEVKNGSYYAMDELLDKYGADIKAEIPESLLNSVKIDGKLYQIPNYQMMVGGRNGIAAHKNSTDKYADAQKIQEVLYNSPTMTEACYDVIEEYLEKLKAGGELNLGVSTETFARLVQKGYQTVGSGYDFVIRRDDPKCKVYNFYETPEMQLFFEKMNDWYKKGYIRKDILAVENVTQDEGKPDGYDLWVTQYFDKRSESLSSQYGFPIELIPQNEEYYYDGGSATGTAISANSKNPDRAMQLLDLLNTKKGKDIYNTLVYGIEGVHYNKVSDTRIETLSYSGAPDSSSAYGQYKWAVGNTFNAYEIPGDLEGWNDYILGLNESCITSPVAGLIFDNSSVKIESAQIATITNEFVRSLNSGAIADYKESYDKMIAKLNAAGAEKYMAELQRQIDEYLSSNNK